MIPYGALLALAFSFLFLPGRYSLLAPSACVAGALLFWWLESKEPGRLRAWVAFGAGALVAWWFAREGWGMGLLPPLAALVGLELDARRRGEEDPRPLTMLVAVGALLVAGYGVDRTLSTTSPVAGGNPRRVVVVGDSLTAGVPGDNVAKLWPEVLGDAIGASVVSLAYPGDTAADAWQRWGERVQARRYRDVPWEPDLAIILLGGNDIRQRRGMQAMEADLRVWVQEFRKQNIPILMIEVPSALTGDPYRPAWQNLQRDFGVARMGSEALRGIFLDRSLTLDGIHMTQRGHTVFAGAVRERLRGG